MSFTVVFYIPVYTLLFFFPTALSCFMIPLTSSFPLSFLTLLYVITCILLAPLFLPPLTSSSKSTAIFLVL